MTQGRHPDRYVIRETTGFDIMPSGATNGSRGQTTHIYIFDSWEGYAIVAAYPPGGNGHGVWSLPQRHLRARAQLDLLNEEHRRWMHGARWSKVPPMQAATVGEDAQATKGKGSR